MGRTRPSVLFLVHIEDMFRSSFPAGRDEGDMDTRWLRRLARACQNHDRVIALVSHVLDDHCVEELLPYVDAEWEWGWGYWPDTSEHEDAQSTIFSDSGPTSDSHQWVIPSDGHQYTWVPDQIRCPTWKNWHITIAGGCESECLADWECVLKHLGLTYRKPENYVY